MEITLISMRVGFALEASFVFVTVLSVVSILLEFNVVVATVDTVVVVVVVVRCTGVARQINIDKFD